MTIDAAVVAFLSGVLGVLITLAAQHLWTDREKKDAKVYLARKLAFEFEGFTIACAEALSDAEPDHPNEYEPGRVGSLPAALTLPEHPAYQWLDGELLERVFMFPQQLSASRRDLAYIWERADGGDYDDQAQDVISDFALRAAKIGADLRTGNGIKPRNWAIDRWDRIAYLEKVRNRRRS